MKFRFDHVNITVGDLEKSLEWYRKIFGFEKLEEGLSAAGKRWAIIGRDDSMVAMTEFAEKIKADRAAAPSTHRIFHFGIRVDNAERWRARVAENNLKLYYGGEMEYPFSRSWYVQDPSGHEIEVSCTDGLPMRFTSSRA
jgi:lactoylglutathione lyase